MGLPLPGTSRVTMTAGTPGERGPVFWGRGPRSKSGILSISKQGIYMGISPHPGDINIWEYGNVYQKIPKSGTIIGFFSIQLEYDMGI